MKIDPTSVLTRNDLRTQAPLVLATCYLECFRQAENERERHYLGETFVRSISRLGQITFEDAPLGEVGKVAYQAYVSSTLVVDDLDASEVWLAHFIDAISEILTSDRALLNEA